MSELLIRQALETALVAALPGIQVVFENTAVQPPATDVPYAKAFFMPAAPINDEWGSRIYQANGIFQVSLFYPLNGGTGSVMLKAEIVRNYFKRASTFSQGGVNVNITHTPQVAKGYEDAGRWQVPITIRWNAWVVVS